MANEIELKLELAPEDADRLETSNLLPGKTIRATQHAIYFDTPEQTLLDAGFALRVRQSGRKRIQTIKANGGKCAGLFIRPEWETPVATDVPVIDERTPLRALLGDRASALAPLFKVHVSRRTWMFTDGPASVELVLDRGRVVADLREMPFCELELELRAGPPAALFTLARQINGVAPVRLGVTSKPERGYQLRAAVPVAFRAEPVDLLPEMPASLAFGLIAQSCLRQYRLNEALLLRRERAPEALHQARVALRRLRSALSLFRNMLLDAQAGPVRDGLRWLAASLGDARNLDVLAGRAVQGDLHDRIVAAATRAHADALEAIESDRARVLMLGIAEWLACGEWRVADQTRQVRDMPVTDFASDQLGRIRRKIKTRSKGLAALSDEERHVVRKQAKKLRYAAEFFASLYSGNRAQRQYRRFVSALETVQDHLGALNDIATARDILRSIGLLDHPDAVDLLGGRKTKKLMAAAVDARGDLLDAKRFWR